MGSIWPPKLGLSSTFSPRTRTLPTTVLSYLSDWHVSISYLAGSATKVFTKRP